MKTFQKINSSLTVIDPTKVLAHLGELLSALLEVLPANFKPVNRAIFVEDGRKRREASPCFDSDSQIIKIASELRG